MSQRGKILRLIEDLLSKYEQEFLDVARAPKRDVRTAFVSGKIAGITDLRWELMKDE